MALVLLFWAFARSVFRRSVSGGVRFLFLFCEDQQRRGEDQDRPEHREEQRTFSARLREFDAGDVLYGDGIHT